MRTVDLQKGTSNLRLRPPLRDRTAEARQRRRNGAPRTRARALGRLARAPEDFRAWPTSTRKCAPTSAREQEAVGPCLPAHSPGTHSVRPTLPTEWKNGPSLSEAGFQKFKGRGK